MIMMAAERRSRTFPLTLTTISPRETVVPENENAAQAINQHQRSESANFDVT